MVEWTYVFLRGWQETVNQDPSNSYESDPIPWLACHDGTKSKEDRLDSDITWYALVGRDDEMRIAYYVHEKLLASWYTQGKPKKEELSGD